MKIKDRAKPKIPAVEPGVYIAVCAYSLDLGEQLCEYKDKAKSYHNQVQLVFELVGETVEIDGKQEPRTLSRTFNIATSKNAGLRKFVQSWFSRQFSDEEFSELDTGSLVGMAAQLSVILNETGEYANIDSIMQLPKGMPAPVATLPLIRFDLEPWSDAAFEALPEWAQDKIKKSTQYQQLHTPADKVAFQQPAPNPAGGGCPF
ncbi:MAG: hypothetical protein RRY53_07580 [Pseudoflavonifractor sp.]